MKLNTYGSVCHNTGKASAGGVFRGPASNWLIGFSAITEITTSYNAELWALLIGICICLQFNYTIVQIKVDSTDRKSVV